MKYPVMSTSCPFDFQIELWTSALIRFKISVSKFSDISVLGLVPGLFT
ncbi:hypothetical protein DAI22_07g199400 [Oryza sativa Japonica Group]|nr:hypothetical protein DAI22_07g199400 [Oryza sativa Japonica Group]